MEDCQEQKLARELRAWGEMESPLYGGKEGEGKEGGRGKGGWEKREGGREGGGGTEKGKREG